MSDDPLGEKRLRLPDIYEVRQGQALSEAVRAGDDRQADLIRQHLLAESATSPQEAAHLDPIIHASMLFQQHMTARSEGDHERAEALMTTLRTDFPRAALQVVLSAALLRVGVEQGWLPENEHDQLTAELADAGPEVSELVGAIKRGRP